MDKVLYKVVAMDKLEKEPYYPEFYLSYFLRQEEKTEVPIYTIPKGGVVPVLEAYEKMVELEKIQAIVLTDGGTDSVMFGNESELGTPVEDFCSIAAVHFLKSVPNENKFLHAVGFGIDTFHGVNHVLFLENVAKLIEQKGYLGCFSITKDMEGFKLTEEALTLLTSKWKSPL